MTSMKKQTKTVLTNIIDEVSKLSYDDMETHYKSDLEKELKEVEKWDEVKNIKLVELNNNQNGIVSNIQNPSYRFEDKDCENIKAFIKKINGIFHLDNFIPNINSEVSEKSIISLLNELKKANSYDYNTVAGLIGKYIDKEKLLVKRLPYAIFNLFSIIKNLQDQDTYPLNYSRWRFLLNNVFKINERYVTPDFYKRLPGSRHLTMHVYMGLIRRLIAGKIEKEGIKNSLSEKDKDFYFDKKDDTPKEKNARDNNVKEKVSENDELGEKSEPREKKGIPLNLILYGPPGTGKTYHTIDKALEILDGTKNDHDVIKFDGLKDAGRIVFTSFHQSMSYEDFIEGIKPEVDEKSNTLKYPVKPGIFKQLCEKASKDTEKKYVLIIDEINRGNVANIFGELITLIEADKREKKTYSTTLPYSSDKMFIVPANLYIIGTMNTADRSVEALDTALRRRFSFEEIMPNPELLKDRQVTIDSVQYSLKDILTTINQRIEVLKDRDHLIGHSYFMEFKDKDNIQEDELRDVFFDKIIPLLQEYFYGDYEKIMMVIGSGFFEDSLDFSKISFAEGTFDIPDGTIYHIKSKNDVNMGDALKKMNIISKTNNSSVDSTQAAPEEITNETKQG